MMNLKCMEISFTPERRPISKLKYYLEDIFKFGETVRTPTDEENPQRTHSWLDVLFERE